MPAIQRVGKYTILRHATRQAITQPRATNRSGDSKNVRKDTELKYRCTYRDSTCCIILSIL